MNTSIVVGVVAALVTSITALVGMCLTARRINPQNNLDISQTVVNLQHAICDMEIRITKLQGELDIWKRRAQEVRARVGIVLQYGKPAQVDETTWIDEEKTAVVAAD